MTDLDISDTLAPNSEQLDAVDLLGGPRTFVIERVTKNNGEQPINVHLAGFPRPWRPGKSMRRVLAACWSRNGAEWVGRCVTLFCDPTVRFGGQDVGGTRIRELSHIDGVKKIPLLVTRGKSAIYTVQPMPEKDAQIAKLRAEWMTASADRKKAIQAEVARLSSDRDGMDEFRPDTTSNPSGITDQQMKWLQAHYKDVDRDIRLADATQRLGVEVESFSALSKDEASRLIDQLDSGELPMDGA